MSVSSVPKKIVIRGLQNIQGGQTPPLHMLWYCPQFNSCDLTPYYNFSNLLHQTLGLSTITCIFAENNELWNTFGLL